MFRRVVYLIAISLAIAGASSFGVAEEIPSDNGDAWPSIRKEVFGLRDVSDGAGKITLEAPERALDAAVVPITVRFPGSSAGKVKSLTIVVDENPSPIAATFNYGEAAGNGERLMATRIRVDRYTFVRAIAEMDDGKLYMARAFVRASGGCSAPASKDPQEAEKSMGKMRIKTVGPGGSGAQSKIAEVMIRHPNTSGMVMDQLTKGYPPARFISKLSVDDNGKRIFSMEGGISISEDPNFRFTYESNGADVLNVTAEDSMGTHFTGHSGNAS